MIIMRTFAIGIIFLTLLACETKTEKPKAIGIELSDMDTTVRPQDDLFRFANGGWLARTQIPPDRGSWNSFSELYERNNEIGRASCRERV